MIVKTKSKSRVLVILLVIVVMLFNSTTITYAATKKDVTKQKKSSVAKLLKPYDKFFEIPLGPGDNYKAVKFDDYYKTNMILYSKIYLSSQNWKKYCNKSISVSKKAFTPQIKKIFGNSAKFKIKTSNNSQWTFDYPNIFKNISGNLMYCGGDHGYVTIYGKVRKVYKTGTNKFQVKYSVYEKQRGTKSKPNNDIDATYSIYLTAKGNSYVVTNIKLSEKAAWKNGKKVYSGSKVKMIKCQK